MTVVSLLTLKLGSGMGCADERETHYVAGTERTYDLPKKIHRLGQSSFVGFSGNVTSSDEILEGARKALSSNPNPSLDDVKDAMKTQYTVVKDRSFQEGYLQRFNLTIKDITKNPKTNSKIVEEALILLKNPGGFGVSALIGGYNEDGAFKIYGISYPGTENVLNKASIGSGSETAERVISMRLSLMNPDQRSNIPKYVGANILMEATRAAWRNSGVGGITQLVWCEDKKANELGWRESNILNNMLYLQEREKVGKPLVDEMFRGVFESGEDYKACVRLLLSDGAMRKLNKTEIMKLFAVESLLV